MTNNRNKKLNEKEDQKQYEIAEEGKVIIKSLAFKKMITHILRFGAESIEDPDEVLGACIGIINGEDKSLILQDIIPVTHGDVVELGFSKEIHDVFEKFNQNFSDKVIKVIGWYHSHLGYGLDLSNSDRKNQLYLQNEQNPLGFSIVFDTKLLGKENIFGFAIYRFRDYSKGSESEILKVNYEIEKPNSLDYFKWIQDLIESSQKKPLIIIKEQNELIKPAPEELQEIPLSEQELVEEGHSDFNSQLSPIFSGFQEGISKLNELFFDVYKEQLSTWMWDVTQGSLKGSEIIRSTINQMKDTIIGGLDNVQVYFDRSFNEISEVFMKDVSEYIDTRIENNKKLKQELNSILTQISVDLKNNLEDNINQILNQLEKYEFSIGKKVSKISDNNNEIEPLLQETSSLISTSFNEANKLSEEVIREIGLSGSRFENKLKTEIDELNLNSNPIKEKYEEVKNLIERLQKLISEFRQLK
ncbi:MAG: hypothetical protein ACFE85_08355 [Candidatus Hodarchaeota archaeon]